MERNNHGHSVLLWLGDHSGLRRLPGHDRKYGWLSSSKGKTLLYNTTADDLREGKVVLHSRETFAQLASIGGATLRAPAGSADDRADAFALACRARQVPTCDYTGELSLYPRTPESNAKTPRSKLDQICAELNIDLYGEWDDLPDWHDR